MPKSAHERHDFEHRDAREATGVSQPAEEVVRQPSEGAGAIRKWGVAKSLLPRDQQHHRRIGGSSPHNGGGKLAQEMMVTGLSITGARSPLTSTHSRPMVGVEQRWLSNVPS